MSIQVKVKGAKQISLALDSVGRRYSGIVKGAVYRGAGMAGEELRRQNRRLPSEHFRYLRDGEKMDVLSPTNVESLSESMGIAKFRVNPYRIETSVGFSGYGPPSTATRKYPRGTPNALIARSVEKGTVVRNRYPLFSGAIERAERPVTQAMRSYILTGIRKEYRKYGG